MSLSLIDEFKSLFMEHKPKGELKWQEDRDLSQVDQKIKTGTEALEELRGDSIVSPLVDVRKKVDQLQLTVLHMIPRWNETEASKVKEAINLAKERVKDLKKEVTTAEGELSWKFWRPEEQQKQLDEVNSDIDGIEETLDKQIVALEKRNDLKIGEGGDFTRHGLQEGWVPGVGKDEGSFKNLSDEEWDNLKKRGVKQDLATGALEMDVLAKGPFGNTHVRKGQVVELANERLKIERDTSVTLRKDMNDRFNERLKQEGPVKEGILASAKMAGTLAELFNDKSINPDDFFKKISRDDGKGSTLKEDGLLFRAIGGIEGQGQFTGNTPPSDIAKDFKGITEKLFDNKGELIKEVNDKGEITKEAEFDDGAANKIQQFISAFVDGLTTVNEGNKAAQDQYDLLWPKLEKAFGLSKEDKFKLMDRVDVYKKLANGLADTGDSGKGARKGLTRKGQMPVDKNNTIEDPEAIISGDISGSMHSQFLAMELAETLSGKAKDEFGQPIKGIQSAGASVQIKNKDVLDSRMLDALSITAGGKMVHEGEEKDFVMHSAYEMINGSQAITGVANKVTQKTATKVMELLKDGKSFSQAMEEALPNEVFPWQLQDAKAVNDRAAGALKEAEDTKEDEQVSAAVDKLVQDIMWMSVELSQVRKEDRRRMRLWMGLDIDRPKQGDDDYDKITKEIETDEKSVADGLETIKGELKKGVTLTEALKKQFKTEKFAWG